MGALILGWVGTQFSEWKKNQWASTRERETRREAQRLGVLEKRNAFQRQTLLELQTAIADMMRATGAAHHADQIQFRSSGRWDREPIGEEWNTKNYETRRLMNLMTVRVRDEGLREQVEKLGSFTSNCLLAQSPIEARSNLALASDLFILVNQRIGEILRTLDDSDDELVK